MSTDRYFHGIAAKTVLVAATLLTFSAHGVDYSVMSYDATSAALMATIPGKRVLTANQSVDFTFAVVSTPSASMSISAQGVGSLQGTPIEARTLSAGWAGKDYVQWCVLTLDPRKLARTVSKELHVQVYISTNQPVYQVSTAASRIPTVGYIVRLPVLSYPKKSLALPQTTPPFQRAVRIEVSRDAIYKITGESLQNLGVPISSIPIKAYRLFNDNEEIPIAFSNARESRLQTGEYINFYGQQLLSKEPDRRFTQFSSTNVYWLAWETGPAGLRVADVSGARQREAKLYIDPTDTTRGIAAKEFPDTVHLEEDAGIFWLRTRFDISDPADTAAISNLDNWYWGSIGRNPLSSFTFDAPSPSSDQTLSARLRIGLMGLTTVDGSVEDHKFNIYLNDVPPGPSGGDQTAVWDGQNEYIFVSDRFPVSQINNGQNTLSFAMVPRTGIDNDIAALNWIEIEYVRNWATTNNSIVFHNHPDNANGLYQFTLTNFTTDDLELWDIEKYRRLVGFDVVPDQNDKTYNLVFQDSITSYTRFLAQAKALQTTPDLMVLDTIKTAWDYPDGVDYVMISTAELLPYLTPLEEVHEARGLIVEKIAIEDIFNRFSGGIRDPESIRSMLKYLFTKHPRNPPRFLLLAGDATHDLYKLPSTRDRTIVPTTLTQIPGWGPGADDGYFATVWGEDIFPDLAVGRFPANDAEQLKLLVDKTVRYITRPERGYWRDNMLLAGGFEPDFTKFNDEAQSVIIGNKMNVLRMDADYRSPYFQGQKDASNVMAGHINAGVYFINFAGHGGGNVWSDSRFFSYDDFAKLHNSQWGASGRLPIVFSFTCLTGFFESTEYKSLGEEFLRFGYDGAIAFYGASAYSKKLLDLRMNRILLETALYGNFTTLGELLTNYEMISLVRYGSQAVAAVRQYNLLGDPALPWHIVPDTMTITLANDALRGADTLAISANTAPVTTGKLKLHVKSGPRTWKQGILDVTAGTASTRIPLKAGATTADGIVRAYAWNDSTEVKGWASFAKDTVMLFDVRIDPALPRLGDSVFVMCKLSIDDTTAQPLIQCLYTVDDPNGQFFNFDTLKSVGMSYDSTTGFWVTNRKIVAGLRGQEYDPKDMFLVKFNVYAVESGQSIVFPFAVAGRPDLAFTNDTLQTAWRNDSLYVSCEVLNKGNKVAPPHTVTFLWGDGATQDTFYHVTNDSLFPAQITRIAFAMPDTQGTVSFTGHINRAYEFDEIISWDNTSTGTMSLVYGDLHNSGDSLISQGGGVVIRPADTLAAGSRVFLFDGSISAASPLSSKSSWIQLFGDSTKAFTLTSRPALDSRDSLTWSFIPAVPRSGTGLQKARADDSSFVSVFELDIVADKWLSRRGNWNTSGTTFSLTTTSAGPFALGEQSDVTPPAIQVFVGGREIRFLDYAAKGKPFNIFITDPSGVVASSVSLRLNSEELAEDNVSEVIQEGDPTTISMTAYPPPSRDIDSLEITAADFAGNSTSQVFAYLPGEELSIKFFSCHPNPFTAREAPGGTKLVRFAYLLTDNASDVTLAVYTIAGRKVWRWKGTDKIGYEEIPWDGRTSDGFRIGNGTYYAKLVAKNSKKKVKKIIKIAKLEGY